MNVILVVLAVLVALPGALVATHLTLLAAAALWYREPGRTDAAQRARFLVLIPAHNEQAVLGPTLAAIYQDLRSGDSVVVVADRCQDATADIARAHGARVLERGMDEAPGRAAARQAGIELALTLEWDAIVMIDADSVIEPGFFDACERMLQHGDALQARSEAASGPTVAAQASMAAFALQGVVVPRGRDRLGLSVRLRGTGMVLRRWIIERYRFRAPASEDLFYSLDLCLDGIRPRHVDSARLRSDSTASWRSAGGQRVRWEAGRMAAAREFAAPLLRRRDAASIEALVHLITPPFALAVLSLVAAAGIAAAAGAPVLAAGIVALLVLLGADLAVGLVLAEAGVRTWLSLLAAPWYVLWKAWVQLRAAVQVRRGSALYAPTPRD